MLSNSSFERLPKARKKGINISKPNGPAPMRPKAEAGVPRPDEQKNINYFHKNKSMKLSAWSMKIP